MREGFFLRATIGQGDCRVIALSVLCVTRHQIGSSTAISLVFVVVVAAAE